MLVVFTLSVFFFFAVLCLGTAVAIQLQIKCLKQGYHLTGKMVHKPEMRQRARTSLGKFIKLLSSVAQARSRTINKHAFHVDKIKPINCIHHTSYSMWSVWNSPSQIYMAYLILGKEEDDELQTRAFPAAVFINTSCDFFWFNFFRLNLFPLKASPLASFFLSNQPLLLPFFF